MKHVLSLFILLIGCLHQAIAQTSTIIIPAANTNGASNNNPYGSFYGYERTVAIYTATELGGAANANRQITKIGFYVNSISAPATTPVKVYVKLVSNTNFAAATDFATQISGALMVYNGNITPAMLTANNWVDIVPTSFLTYNGTSHLAIMVETNATGGGNEGSTGKQFRWSNPSNGTVALTWQQDSSPPTGNGSTSATRPNVRIDLTLPPPCAGMPTAGTASGPALACPTTPVNLMLAGSTYGTNIVIQWESRVPAGTGTWQPISGANASTYSTLQTVATDYRASVTCTSLVGGVDYSNIVAVGMNTFFSCYCIPTYSNGGGGDNILSVRLKNLYNPTTGNNAPYFQDYSSQQPSPLPIPVLITGYPDTVKLTFGTDGTQYSRIWIDFNKNAVFETTESFSLGTNAGANGSAAIPFVTPANATPGIVKMRIRGGDDAQLANTQPCGASSSTYGEAEDYLVEIKYKPLPPNISANNTVFCAGDTLKLTATSSAPGAVILWSGPASFSTTGSPVGINGIQTSQAGIYMAKVAVGIDTSEPVGINITVNPTPSSPTAINDTVCMDHPAVMSVIVENQGFIYEWYETPTSANVVKTGPTVSIPSLATDSFLYVRGRSTFGCLSSRVQVAAIIGDPPTVALGNDTVVCSNMPLTLQAYNEFGLYTWNTGEITPTIVVNRDSGLYWVVVDRYCIRTDTISIDIDHLPSADGINYLRTNGNTYKFSGLNIQRSDDHLWLFGDGTQDTSLTPTHAFGEALVYDVRLVLYNHCGTDTTLWQTATNVSNTAVLEHEIMLYPNPANDLITIKTGRAVNIEEVFIMNNVGALVYKKDIKGKQLQNLDVSSLPPGNYIIRMHTDKGVVNRAFDILR